jgi:CDP-diacylglycerol--glycerol-3-phosphate 3-phosphatidyltransferase
VGRTIYNLKPAFQDLLRPLCRALARAGITANAVTMTAAVLSVALGGLVAVFPSARWPLLLIPAGLFVRMALNAIDGMLAREYGMKSALGGILNEIGDVVSDASLYLPFALLPGVSAPLVVATVLLSLMSEMVGVVTVQIGASRRYDGPMGKSDRAFLFGLVALLLGLGVPAGRWLDVLLGLMALLLVVTCLRRARRGLAELS